MAYIIDDLIAATKSMPQVHPLWKARVAEDVLTPFFACFVANLADSQTQAWYENFVTKTAFAYEHAKANGGALTGSALYWQNPLHTKLAYYISRATLVDKALFKAIFPVVTHMGYNLLQQYADEKDVTLKAYAAAYLDDLASFLPAWAGEVVAVEALEQITVAHSFLDKPALKPEPLPKPELPSTRQVFMQLDSRLDSLIDDETLDDSLTLHEDNKTTKTATDKTATHEQQTWHETTDDKTDVAEDKIAPVDLVFELNEPSTPIDVNLDDDLSLDLVVEKPVDLTFDLADDEAIYETQAHKVSPVTQNPLQDNSSQDNPSQDILPDDAAQTMSEDWADNTANHPLSDDEPTDNLSAWQNADEINDDTDEQDLIDTADDKQDSHQDSHHSHHQNQSQTDSKPINDWEDDWAMPTSPKKSKRVWVWASAMVLLAGLGAGAFWFYQQHNQNTAAVETVEQAKSTAVPEVVSLPPTYLSLTVGQRGELYACQAEVGNATLADELSRLLNDNFANALCVIDINANLSQTMVSSETLTSVIALLKSSSYANLELLGNQFWIHAPNADDVTRLVRDIGAITANQQIQVLPRPPLDTAAEIERSLEKANTAIAALPQNADDYALARVMSMAIFDMQDGVPSTHWHFLQQAAEHLKVRPNTRLIIVVHRDETDDNLAARSQTQQQAEMIKNKLIEFGVGENQLVAQGVGFDFPVMDNQTALGRFKNRRVEFLVYDEAIMQALSTPMTVATAVQMPEPQMMTTAVDDQLPIPEPLPSATVVNTSQPVYGVENGQIVEYGMPQVGETPLPVPSPTVSEPVYTPSLPIPIDEDLLKPIGIYPAAGQGSQVH